jgi:hypothetical protein
VTAVLSIATIFVGAVEYGVPHSLVIVLGMLFGVYLLIYFGIELLIKLGFDKSTHPLEESTSLIH